MSLKKLCRLNGSGIENKMKRLEKENALREQGIREVGLII